MVQSPTPDFVRKNYLQQTNNVAEGLNGRGSARQLAKPVLNVQFSSSNSHYAFKTTSHAILTSPYQHRPSDHVKGKIHLLFIMATNKPIPYKYGGPFVLLDFNINNGDIIPLSLTFSRRQRCLRPQESGIPL